MTLTVAILGRPNVGKSTLFNRLVGKRLALVDETPGVTRDRRESTGRIGPLALRIIDTAGLEDACGDSLEARMRRQTELALDEADAVLLLIDARAGVTPMDREFANWVRKFEIPVLLVANKCESRTASSGLAEAYELGLGEPIAISAEHGEGLDALYDVLAPLAEAEDAQEQTEAGPVPPLQLAIVGRPNAGKSTLINRLVGEERLLTGAEPGITRDAIAVDWTYRDRRIRLVDTAGQRRRAKALSKLEKLSVADARRASDLAQVVVLLVDGTAPLERQELTIARHVTEEGRALVVAINKWDLVQDRNAVRRAIGERLQASLTQVRGVPVVPVSALTGEGLDRLMPTVLSIFEVWNRRVPTGALNRWLAATTERHPPPAVNGRRIRLRYITQPKTRPPTFAVFTSRPSGLPDSYLRYLTNALRDDFGLEGVPIRLGLRKVKNPYTGAVR